ncbi:MAG: helix-turn-helix domain-containing protein [Bacteroidota bacterium]
MRQLAAILFTDIAGYTALMQNDEQLALSTRAMHRKIFEHSHGAYNGKIIQYYGDGTLSIFHSAVQAAACCMDMQKQLRSADIPVRMGLHVGDIHHTDTEVYGDGVNVASRIESISVPGAVLLSGRVEEELRNQKQFSTQSLGRFEFKNVADPIEVFALANKGFLVPKTDELKGKGRPARSIAVLPFVNMSANEENEYFSDGITEEIINALTKIKELKVTSRTSSFYFKKSELRLQEIAHQLNVALILEGSIRLAGNQVRITSQLIDVTEDSHFWSETFDRQLDNIFAVQDEVSLQIADKIREHVGHLTIEQHLVKDAEVPADAYSDYLRSKHLILQMHREGIDSAIDILQRVVMRQPNYAYAHLGLHQAYTIKAVVGFMPSAEGFALGHQHLQQAIEVDESLPEIQIQLAWVSFLQEWDLPKAYRHLQRVGEELPLVDYYQTMASVLAAEKKIQTARRYLAIAEQLDPFSHINPHLKGFLFYIESNYEQAISCYHKSIELKPEGAVSILELGQAHILLGHHEKALQHFRELPDGSDDILRDGGQAMAHIAMGNVDLAEPLISRLNRALQTDSLEHALHLLILCETLRGNHESALSYLAQAVKHRLPLLVYIWEDPMLKPLHGDDRFHELVSHVTRTGKVLKEESRYKKSLLGDGLLAQSREAVLSLMETERPFLDPYLSLRNLAGKVNLSPNQLSQLLNEGFDKNFSEFVNAYRLETFKQKVSEPKNKQFTLLALAYESGFNSKTVFNTYFKKATGMTPKAYWNSVHV